MPNSTNKIRTTIDPHVNEKVEEMVGDYYGTKSSMVNKAIEDLYNKHRNTVELRPTTSKLLLDYLEETEGNQSIEQMANRIIIHFLKSQKTNEQDS